MRWQRSAAACIEPSGKSKCVFSGSGRGYSASRRCTVSGSASTITPGLRMPLRVEQPLDLAHRAVELVAEDARVERRAHTPVAVLGGVDAVEGGHQLDDLLGHPLQRLHLVGPREVDVGPHVQAADRAVAVEAGARDRRARGSRGTRARSRRAARERPRCPRRTPPAACGPRWRPSAARARPCGPWSARPARRRSRRAACGSRGRARATRAPAGRACRAPRRRVSPEKETNSSASGSPSRRSASCRYSSLERERSRIVRSISSTALGSSASASSVAAIAASRSSKCPTANILAFGSSTSLTVAAVTTASVPSEPTISFERSNGSRRSSR